MEIVLQLFLNIYYGFLVIFFIFALFNLYHFFKFGFLTFGSIFFSFMFIGGTVFLLYFSFVQIEQIDWSTSFTIFDYSQSDVEGFFKK